MIQPPLYDLADSTCCKATPRFEAEREQGVENKVRMLKLFQHWSQVTRNMPVTDVVVHTEDVSVLVVHEIC